MWEVLTVLGLPSGGEGFAIDLDLVNEEKEQKLVTGGRPLLSHGAWLVVWLLRC